MAKRLLLTTLLIWIVAVLIAESPPPPPPPTVAAQIKRDVSRVEDAQPQAANSTVQTSPTAINETTANPTQNSANTNQEAGARDTPFNWSRLNTIFLTVFNGILAFVAVFQWQLMRRQTNLTETGLVVAKDAAVAAKKSADVATAAADNVRITERAIVLIEDVDATMSTPAHGLDVDSAVIFTLKNFGRTIANGVELTGALTGIGNLPIDKSPPTTIAPQGTNSWASLPIKHFAVPELIQKLNQGTGRLDYKIVVTYADTFGTYRYHCEGRYEPALKRFLITASKTD